ncbi:hypothetical protein [Achromobacter kerstersii]|uniref:hypothetical protein n=1 Tax=Achromobacter kerstersii TaxID=1353890 RepID=UPI003D04B809
MPNWVTTKIRTEPEAIKAITNKDDGRIDFSLAMPFPGEFPWDGISLRAEEMAEIVIGVPVNDHPLIASLQRSSRSEAKLSDLCDEDFEQFVQMLRNHRKCGFLHQMDFARASWGTKWNACENSVSEDGTEASFDSRTPNKASKRCGPSSWRTG